MIPLPILLDKAATYKKFAPGDVIFEGGTRAQFYYKLVSGRIRWCSFLDDGKEVLHNVVEPGDSFGELPLFDEEPYAATALADSPVTVLRLPVSVFKEILVEHTDLHFAFTKSIARKLRFKYYLSELLAKNNPVFIIDELITYFNTHQQFICEECRRLMLTRQQLANMTGMRVETVIRAIRHMEKEEKVNIVKGKVFIPADGL